MKLENLTEKHLEKIVELYEQICGFNRDFRTTMYQEPARVLSALKERREEEYRIGSKWDGQSKIYFKVDIKNNFSVRFNSNFDPSERKGKIYDEAESAGQEFTNQVKSYLESIQI